MRNSSDAGREDEEVQDLDIEISDLPPDRRSHFLLLKLEEARKRGRESARRFARSASPTPTHDTRNGGEEDEESALEFSDLPPGTRSHYLLLKLAALKARVQAIFPFLRHPAGRQRTPLTRAQRRMRIGRALTALGLCATILLLLVGNVPGLRTRLLTLLQPSAPTPAATSAISYSSGSIFTLDQGVPIVVERHGQVLNPDRGTPGPLPTICPQADMLQAFMTPLDPPGLGGGPIWLTGFIGPTAALVDLQPLGTSLSHPQGQTIGWYEGLAVFLQRGFRGTITLRGESQGPGGLVFFAGSNVVNFNPILTLDSSSFHLESLPSGSQWQVTSINVIVPFAGCYTLHATWAGGSWDAFFAAGV